MDSWRISTCLESTSEGGWNRSLVDIPVDQSSLVSLVCHPHERVGRDGDAIVLRIIFQSVPSCDQRLFLCKTCPPGNPLRCCSPRDPWKKETSENIHRHHICDKWFHPCCTFYAIGKRWTWWWAMVCVHVYVTRCMYSWVSGWVGECVFAYHTHFFFSDRTSPSSKDTRKLFVPPFFFDLYRVFFIWESQSGLVVRIAQNVKVKSAMLCVYWMPFWLLKSAEHRKEQEEERKRGQEEMEMDVE